MTCQNIFFPSWGRAHLSQEQSSYEIICIELRTIQKISLAGWRLFYFHQQIHVHVTRPYHVMSYCIISSHIMSCIRHVFRFHLVSRACWFLPLCGGVVHASWGKCVWINVPVSGRGVNNPYWRLTILEPLGGGVKDCSGISLSYLPATHN